MVTNATPPVPQNDYLKHEPTKIDGGVTVPTLVKPPPPPPTPSAEDGGHD